MYNEQVLHKHNLYLYLFIFIDTNKLMNLMTKLLTHQQEKICDLTPRKQTVRKIEN